MLTVASFLPMDSMEWILQPQLSPRYEASAARKLAKTNAGDPDAETPQIKVHPFAAARCYGIAPGNRRTVACDGPTGVHSRFSNIFDAARQS